MLVNFHPVSCEMYGNPQFQSTRLAEYLYLLKPETQNGYFYPAMLIGSWQLPAPIHILTHPQARINTTHVIMLLLFKAINLN